MKRTFAALIALLLSLGMMLTGCMDALPFFGDGDSTTTVAGDSQQNISLSDIPAFSGTPYVALNNNIPEFTEEELTTASYETYSKLDSLGRCGVAISCIGIDLMPTEDRESISSVKPSGWQSVKYDIVDGKYLYNRCHLIGFQLTGENANKENLITGTRYMNVDGMLPFENMVADYIKETENHVMYRVTPIFEGNNLVASGVQIEAYSVEDKGDGICFNVYVYNAQPGVQINYADGTSALSGEVFETGSSETTGTTDSGESVTYILNTGTKKFHKVTCGSADSISEANKDEFVGNREDLITQGYEPCGSCKP